MIGTVRDFTSDETLNVYTNGGSKDFSQIAPLKFLPLEVRFNPESMGNIIVTKYFDSITGAHISMGSSKERVIIVEDQNEIIEF